MADDAKTAGREPWWTRQRAGDEAPGAEEEGAPAPPAGGAPWLGQTEPFLRALERSLDPLEDALGRVADAARANHAEMERLGGETETGLRAVTDALAEARKAFAASAESVRARADATAALIERAGAEVERLAGLLAETEERAAAARAADREAVERRVTEAVADLAGAAQRESTAATAGREALEQRVAEAVEQLTAAVRETEGRLAEAAQGESAAATAGREALEGRVTEAVAKSDAQLARSLREAVEAAATRAAGDAQELGAQVESAQGSLGELVTRSTGELDVKLRTALRDTADEHAAQAGALEARLEDAAEHLPVLLDALRDALADSHGRSETELRRLGDLVQAMAARRGFQELVASETALREEQAAFVAGLTGASKLVEEQVAVVTGHAHELAQKLDAAAGDAAALREVPPQTAELVAGTMAEAGESLEHSLRAAFADVLERLDRLAAAHSEATTAAGTVADAAGELRTRMEGWGEARSVPHIAEELAALDDRVRRIEQFVADDLPGTLAQQVVEALDRREAEKPKGFFKRT
jgi:hypothetical protein